MVLDDLLEEVGAWMKEEVGVQALLKEEEVQAWMKEEVEEYWGVLVDLLVEQVDWMVEQDDLVEEVVVDWMVEQDDLLEELECLEVVLDYSFGIAFLIVL